MFKGTHRLAAIVTEARVQGRLTGRVINWSYVTAAGLAPVAPPENFRDQLEDSFRKSITELAQETGMVDQLGGPASIAGLAAELADWECRLSGPGTLMRAAEEVLPDTVEGRLLDLRRVACHHLAACGW